MQSRTLKSICSLLLLSTSALAGIAGEAQSASRLAFSSDLLQEGRVPWTRVPNAVNTPDFSFALFGDRTGMAYPGGIDRAVRQVNASLQSSGTLSFVLSVGDNIEGYTRDPAVLTAMWNDFDKSAEKLAMPFIRVPGNHDISDDVMRRIYESRYGRPYFYFLYDNVLFLGLDTEDPPPAISSDKERQANAAILRIAADGALHPDRQVAVPGQSDPCDVEASHAALGSLAVTHISDDQLQYFSGVLREHSKVRWTYLFMHRPPWRTPQSGNFAKLRKSSRQPQLHRLCRTLSPIRTYQDPGLHDYYILGPTAALPRCTKSDAYLNQIVTVRFDSRHPSVTREFVNEH